MIFALLLLRGKTFLLPGGSGLGLEWGLNKRDVRILLLLGPGKVAKW